MTETHTTLNPEQQRTLALAAVFQAATLVQAAAYGKDTDPEALETSIYSLFQLEVPSVAAVFGDIEGLETGLRRLHDTLHNAPGRDREISRYVIALLHLERKLEKRTQLLDKIGSEIDRAQERLAHFDLLHANILAQLASLYSETISTLKPRIMVNGDPYKLQDTDNANRIRALLLAGIRAAMLWYQLGGSRLHLLTRRGALSKTARQLIDQIEERAEPTPPETANSADKN